MSTQTTLAHQNALYSPDPSDLARRLAKRSFATLSTVSPRGWPHAAGVLYEMVGGRFFVSTDRASRKARNVALNPNVAMAIPVRRVPVGPPSLVHFQGSAEVLAVDDTDIVTLRGSGRLKSITSHGELDLPDGCLLRITPLNRISTYGLGMPLIDVVRSPLELAGSVPLPLP